MDTSIVHALKVLPYFKIKGIDIARIKRDKFRERDRLIRQVSTRVDNLLIIEVEVV